jgi:hypothetical protein
MKSSSTFATRTGSRPSATSSTWVLRPSSVIYRISQTHNVARQVNRLGQLDAVIHNAGVLSGPDVLPVNVVAPYVLTALIHRPQRLVSISSSMHRSGRASLTSIDWSGNRTTGSYSDSKLFVTTLAAAPEYGQRCSATRWTPAGYPRRWAAPPHPMICGSGTSPRSGSPPAMMLTPALQAATGITSAAPKPTPPYVTRGSKIKLLEELAHFTDTPLVGSG